MSLVNRSSLDPSLALPWWDKVRLLLHGRLLLLAEHFTLRLHASLDPYNTAEEMELTWTDLALDWTNARLDLAGDLSVFVRTASKYDDARLLQLPHLRVRERWLGGRCAEATERSFIYFLPIKNYDHIRGITCDTAYIYTHTL